MLHLFLLFESGYSIVSSVNGLGSTEAIILGVNPTVPWPCYACESSIWVLRANITRIMRIGLWLSLEILYEVVLSIVRIWCWIFCIKVLCEVSTRFHAIFINLVIVKCRMNRKTIILFVLSKVGHFSFLPAGTLVALRAICAHTHCSRKITYKY